MLSALVRNRLSGDRRQDSGSRCWPSASRSVNVVLKKRQDKNPDWQRTKGLLSNKNSDRSLNVSGDAETSKAVNPKKGDQCPRKIHAPRDKLANKQQGFQDKHGRLLNKSSTLTLLGRFKEPKIWKYKKHLVFSLMTSKCRWMGWHICQTGMHDGNQTSGAHLLMPIFFEEVGIRVWEIKYQVQIWVGRNVECRF